MKEWFLSLVIVAGLLPSWLAGPLAAIETKADLYLGWESDLRRYVDRNGDVNYMDWKGNRTGVDVFLQAASRVTAQEYSRMSKEEKLALWINIYNAFTVKQILDHYPIHRSGFNLYPQSSIRQIPGIWDRYRVSVASRSVTLNDIEHKILRGEMKEPLIHFAINCASRGCPKLLNKAYRASSIHQELDEAARDFVNDPKRNKIDALRRTVELSQILDWFGDDFKGRYGGKALVGRSTKESAVINLLLQYMPAGDKKVLILSNKFSLRYMTYDWSLNDQGASR
ncbi:MAG: DUF547 domain-containing protein [Candidatus Melainabacteria bacterium]|nr:DUF547 domain-containing protein [Candidatus Melainabacteria bacterium]